MIRVNCKKCGEIGWFDGQKCDNCGGYMVENEDDVNQLKDQIRKKLEAESISIWNREIVVKNLRELADHIPESNRSKIKQIGITNNELESIEGIELFPNAIDLELSFNKITDISILPKRNWGNLDFAGNPIERIDQKVIDNLSCVDLASKYITTSRTWYFGDSIKNKDWITKLDWEKLKENTNLENLKSEGYFVFVIQQQDEHSKSAGFINFKNGKHGLPVSEMSKDETLKKLGIKTGCFIATVVTGDYNNSTVIDLRLFRDNWLRKIFFGNSFINCYYKYGEIVAKKIESHEFLKKLFYHMLIKPLHRIIVKFNLHNKT